MNQFVSYEYRPGLWNIYQYVRDTPTGIDYVRFTEEGENMPRIYTTPQACVDRAAELNKERAH